ncbi:hypothetical protein K7432_009080 [Basidiobolus ranarum]|uniref:SCP domain-containing protein n=1 Tax=Basidiobolus ranarum TaxID=34480 RepID=A0ABR2VXL9_9FUNG
MTVEYLRTIRLIPMIRISIWLLFICVVLAGPQEQLDLVNKERRIAGAKPLQLDSRLVECAQLHTDYQVRVRKMTHDEPGRPLEVRVDAVNVVWANIGENVANGYQNDEEVVRNWMESPGHRQNILNPQFTHLGVGFSSTGYYWTQVFARISGPSKPYLAGGQEDNNDLSDRDKTKSHPTASNKEKAVSVDGKVHTPLKSDFLGSRLGRDSGIFSSKRRSRRKQLTNLRGINNTL